MELLFPDVLTFTGSLLTSDPILQTCILLIHFSSLKYLPWNNVLFDFFQSRKKKANCNYPPPKRTKPHQVAPTKSNAAAVIVFSCWQNRGKDSSELLPSLSHILGTLCSSSVWEIHVLMSLEVQIYYSIVYLIEASSAGSLPGYNSVEHGPSGSS